MRSLSKRIALILGLMFTTMSVIASPAVDAMSDMEVTEYAIKLSGVMRVIQDKQLCKDSDIHCIRAEFKRHGTSYDDKEAVQKRLVILVGSIY